MKRPYNYGKGKCIRWLREHLTHAGTACLIWPYGRDDKGYGVLGFEGKIYKASRLIAILVLGPPPSEKYQAAHSCNNGHLGCVNINHISWKTPRGNTQDAIDSGKYGSGVGWKGKLKATQVSEIKALAGVLTNIELGLIYKVHAETIAKIRRGETWQKVA